VAVPTHDAAAVNGIDGVEHLKGDITCCWTRSGFEARASTQCAAGPAEWLRPPE
jgi:hypothetical protein